MGRRFGGSSAFMHSSILHWAIARKRVDPSCHVRRIRPSARVCIPSPFPGMTEHIHHHEDSGSMMLVVVIIALVVIVGFALFALRILPLQRQPGDGASVEIDLNAPPPPANGNAGTENY